MIRLGRFKILGGVSTSTLTGLVAIAEGTVLAPLPRPAWRSGVLGAGALGVGGIGALVWVGFVKLKAFGSGFEIWGGV